MGRSAHVFGFCGPDTRNDVTWLATLFAAVAFAPAQPVTIAVVDTGANVRAPRSRRRGLRPTTCAPTGGT